MNKDFEIIDVVDVVTLDGFKSEHLEALLQRLRASALNKGYADFEIVVDEEDSTTVLKIIGLEK